MKLGSVKEDRMMRHNYKAGDGNYYVIFRPKLNDRTNIGKILIVKLNQ